MACRAAFWCINSWHRLLHYNVWPTVWLLQVSLLNLNSALPSGTWHKLSKTLLLRKAAITYHVVAESRLAIGKYGHVLKYARLGLHCFGEWKQSLKKYCKPSGGLLNIKISSCKYRDPRVKDKKGKGCLYIETEPWIVGFLGLIVSYLILPGTSFPVFPQGNCRSRGIYNALWHSPESNATRRVHKLNP